MARNVIKPRRGSTVPTADNLEINEFSVDHVNQIIYGRGDDGVVRVLASAGGSSSQRFKVANAVDDDEAMSKAMVRETTKMLVKHGEYCIPISNIVYVFSSNSTKWVKFLGFEFYENDSYAHAEMEISAIISGSNTAAVLSSKYFFHIKQQGQGHKMSGLKITQNTISTIGYTKSGKVVSLWIKLNAYESGMVDCYSNFNIPFQNLAFGKLQTVSEEPTGISYLT